jgi:hypothetical protein
LVADFTGGPVPVGAPCEQGSDCDDASHVSESSCICCRLANPLYAWRCQSSAVRIPKRPDTIHQKTAPVNAFGTA